jgi:hypothetical protein
MALAIFVDGLGKNTHDKLLFNCDSLRVPFVASLERGSTKTQHENK